jgi:hypothetical protein
MAQNPTLSGCAPSAVLTTQAIQHNANFLLG